MPELPEVEVARRILAGTLRKGQVVRVQVLDGIVGAGADAASGMRVASVARRGKWLRIGLQRGAALFAHLGMSGEWVAVSTSAPMLKYERVRLLAERRRGAARGALAYVDPRRLGRVRFAKKAIPAWLALGPDALGDEIDAPALHARLRARSGPIKAALLDQRLLAGVGNIHAVEALWRARIDPRRRADTLSLAEVRALLTAVRASLRRGLRVHERAVRPRYVRTKGTPNPFQIYGHADEPCPRCGARLRKIVLAGRGTTFCAVCQR